MIEIKKIGVLGAGIMGSGIAQVTAQAGYQVTMRDIKDRFLEKGFDSIRKSFELMQNKGRLTEERGIEILSRIKGTTDFREAVGDADLVIEAIPENLELKRQIFKDLDETCPRHTILASNTSSLSITAMAATTKRPEKVIGMHFANPPAMMMAVELIVTIDTSEETLEIAKGIVRKVGKEYEVVKDFPGFGGTRMLTAFMNEALWIVFEGISSPEDIDKHCRLQYRHPMGPLELADFIGLDTVLSSLEYLHRELGERFLPCPLLKQIVVAGHLGKKTGRGIYKYTTEGKVTKE